MSFTSSALPSLRASTTQCESGRLHSSPSPQKCDGLLAGRNTSAIRMPRVQKAMQYLHHSRVLQASLLNFRSQHLCLTRRVQPRESQHETTDFWDRRMDNLGRERGKQGPHWSIPMEAQLTFSLATLCTAPVQRGSGQCLKEASIILRDNFWQVTVTTVQGSLTLQRTGQEMTGLVSVISFYFTSHRLAPSFGR